jgi:hypothetical protein
VQAELRAAIHFWIAALSRLEVTRELSMTDGDVEQVILRELETGERLLWSGRPGQGLRVRRADAFAIPFSLFWAGFAVFWEAGVVSTRAPLFMRLWGIPFLAIGAYMVAGRFITDAWTRRNTVYGVTDRRVIVISGLFTLNTTSHALSALPAVTLTERRNGEGDVVLADTDMSHVATGGMVSRGRSVPPALEFLSDARHVYEILRAAQRQAA